MGLSLGELTFTPAMRPSTLRDAIAARLNSLGKGKGLLVTIDETQDASLEDMTAIATAAQHMLRENAEVAFVFAGLPSLTSDLLNAKVLTFLRRAPSNSSEMFLWPTCVWLWQGRFAMRAYRSMIQCWMLLRRLRVDIRI